MADSFDINRYSLTLELQLNTDKAFKSLDMLGDKAGEMEQKISDAAQRSLDSISDAVENVSRAMADVAEKFTQATTGAKQVVPLLLKQQDITNDMYDQFLDESKDRKHEHDHQLFMIKSLETIKKAMDEENQLVMTFYKSLGQIVDVIGDKNQGHKDQINYLRQEPAMMQRGTEAMREQNKEVQKTTGSFRDMWKILTSIRIEEGLILDATDEFHTANFRMYGDMMGIVQQTTNLSDEFGVLRENAIAAYKALGNMRVPRDEINKYAKTITLTNRITGIGIDELAEYTQRMRQSGLTSQDATKQLAWMSDQMRRLSLSTQDLNKVLGDTTLNGRVMQDIFGGDKEAMLKIDKMKVGFLELSQAMTGGTEHGHKMNQALTQLLNTSKGLAKLENFVPDGTLNSAEEVTMALNRMGQEIDREMKAIEASGASAVDMSASMQVLADVYGLGSIEALQLLRAQEGLKTSLAGSAAAFDASRVAITDHDRAVGAMEKRYAEASQNAHNAVARFGAAVQSMFVRIQTWVEAFVVPFMTMISVPLEMITWLLDRFNGVLDVLEGFTPIGYIIARSIKFILGALLVLPPIIITIVSALHLLGFTFGRLFSSVSGGGGVFTSLGNLIVSVFSTIGRAFEAMVTPIGRGLASLGQAVMPVIPGILAVGAALLMAGAGAYMFAQAVAIVADKGWAGVGAMLALSGVLALLAVGMVALAGPAMAVAPGLLVLGAAMLMVGGAAWMMGAGIALSAEGIVKIAGVASKLVETATGMLAVAGAATVFAASLGALALVGAFLAAPLTALGVALLPLGAAAMMIGIGMAGAAAAFWLVVDAIGPHSPPMWEKFVLIGIGLAALAAIAFFAAIPITTLGIGLGIAAGAAWLLYISIGPILNIFSALGEMVRSISATINQAAKSFVDFMNIMKSGGITFGQVAGVMLTVSLGILLLGASLLGLGMMVSPVLIPLAALAGILVLVGGAAWLIGQGMKSASDALVQLTAPVVNIGGILQGMAVGMWMVAGAAGSFGLAILGLAAVAVIAAVPLLGLGAAMWLAGEGSRLLGVGVQTISGAVGAMVSSISAIGPALVDAALGMMGVVSNALAFSAALILLAGVAVVVAVPIAALGVGLLAVGAGAWMIGQGMMMAANAMTILSNLTQDIGVRLALMANGMIGVALASVAFSGAVLSLGIVGLVAAAPIAALGGAMWLLGLGVQSVASGLSPLVATFQSIITILDNLIPGLISAAGGMAIFSIQALGFAVAITAISAAAWFGNVALLLLGASMMMIGQGVTLAASGIQVMSAAFDNITGNAARFAQSFISINAGVQSIADAALIAVPALGMLVAALWASLPVALAAGFAWGGFSSVFDDISTSVEYVSVRVENLVSSITSLGTRLGSAFRNASAGSTDLTGIATQAAAIDAVFTQLSNAADKIAGIEHTATNIDVAIRHLSESGSRLRGIKEIFKEFSSALLTLVDSVSTDAVTKMEKVSLVFVGFANSLNVFSTSFSRATTAMNSAVSFDVLSDKLLRLANSFERAMAVMGGKSLAALVDSQMVGLQASIDSMAVLLNRYADLLENAATRVEVAILARALPAMARAKAEGVVDVVRAETVATVLVKDQPMVEAPKSQEVDAIIELGGIMLDVLDAIVADSTMSEAGRERIAEILAKNGGYNGEGGGRGGLASDINNWRT